jgi:sugar phosphate isomerase/epimerase
MTRAAGLGVAEIVAQIDAIVMDEAERENRIAWVESVIDVCGELGLSPVNVMTGPAVWLPGHARIPQDLSAGAAWDMAVDALTRYAARATRADVTLAVEAVFGQVAHDYFSLRELLRRAPSPALKVNFDPSHFFLYRNDVPWCARALGDLIAHCHMKDAVGTPGMPGDQFLFPLLGEGGIDWAATLEALETAGYRGFLTVEFEAFAYYRRVLGGDAEAAARLSLDALRKLDVGATARRPA